MADFAAVIRRAVDGLTENTPEMRVKVYEKARGAVQRQLESMKPRPPEDMLRRQLDKLEQAIQDVEGEHAEALPAEEEEDALSYGAETEPAEDEQSYEERTEQESAETPHSDPHRDEDLYAASEDGTPVHGEIQTTHDDGHDRDWHDAGHHEPETADAAPVVVPEEPVYGHDTVADADEPASETPAHETPIHEPWDEPVEPPASDESSTGIVPDERQIGLWQEPLPEDTAVSAPASQEPAVYAEAQTQADADPVPEPLDDHLYAAPDREPWELAHEAAADRSAPVEDEAWRDEPEPLSTEAAPEPAQWEAPAADPLAADPLAEGHFVRPAPAAVPRLERLADHEPLFETGQEFPASAHFEPEVLTATPTAAPAQAEAPFVTTDASRGPGARSDKEPAQQPAMPPALDLLDWDENGFEAPDANKASAAPVRDEAGKAPEAARDDDGWSEFGDLLAPPARSETKAAGAGMSDPAFGGAGAGPISYRVEPKRRSYKGLIAGIVLVALLGGAGYAGWLYKDKLTEMAHNLTKAGVSVSENSKTPASTPAVNGAGQGTTAPAGNSAATNAAKTGTDVASAGNSQPEIAKFTQRLLADGSEQDSGPAQAAAQPAATEGKSVAEQNVASNATPAVTGTATSATPATPAQQAPAAQQQPVPAATGQGDKMFLYEERIGQSVPTAIAGSVAWSLQQETGENGKSEPTVQAQINVPERGLSALMTFKRNTDPSLPASHLVEIVFSLPSNFEGGAIESVQRIAMKTTEQDRGNPLVAVPAKITDDFHMIALNDFPEARATNLELLRTRNWLDIPVTYRNGRRALLTLEKGKAGVDAFNKAIQAWNALGPATPQQ